MTRLKPCPFCGNENIFVGTIEQIQGAATVINTHYDNTHYKVVCDFNNGGCGATTGGQYDDDFDAKMAWDKRV